MERVKRVRRCLVSQRPPSFISLLLMLSSTGAFTFNFLTIFRRVLVETAMGNCSGISVARCNRWSFFSLIFPQNLRSSEEALTGDRGAAIIFTNVSPITSALSASDVAQAPLEVTKVGTFRLLFFLPSSVESHDHAPLDKLPVLRSCREMEDNDLQEFLIAWPIR